jgi:hypothetical protein
VYEKARQDMGAHEVERSTCLNELVALKRAKAKKAKAPTIKSASGRPFPSSFPGGSLTSEEVCLYIPEGTRIYRDAVNGRWQCTHSLYGRRLTRSFAFMLHGFEHACKLCVQTRWLEVCLFHGIEPDTCPMQICLHLVGRQAASLRAHSLAPVRQAMVESPFFEEPTGWHEQRQGHHSICHDVRFFSSYTPHCTES